MKSYKKTFTLIDLLIIIAILSALAAVLLPVFASMRAMDQQEACASNLKQLGAAYAEYAHDNDGMFPGVARQDAGWGYPLYQYTKNYGVYQCPDDPVTSPSPTQIHVSYGQNANFNDYIDPAQNRVDFTANGAKPVGLSKITSPSLTVAIFETTNKIEGPNVFFESMGMSNNEGGSDTGDGYDGMWTARYATGVMGSRQGKDNSGNPTAATARHSTGSNFLAVDGHVSYLPGSKVSNGFSPPDSTDPQGEYAPVGVYYTAAGASNMTDGNGAKFSLTFSTK